MNNMICRVFVILTLSLTPTAFSFANECAGKIEEYVYSLAYTVEHGLYISQDRIDYAENEIQRVRKLQKSLGSCEALKYFSSYVQDTSSIDTQNKQIEQLKSYSEKTPEPAKRERYTRSYTW